MRKARIHSSLSICFPFGLYRQWTSFFISFTEFSARPLDWGLKGLDKMFSMSSRLHQSLNSFESNSGPPSEKIFSGIPKTENSEVRTLITSPDVAEVPRNMAMGQPENWSAPNNHLAPE